MMAESESQKNKRIAKNTLMLYMRMILIMAVTLYTSRVILEALGESDYGIYNVVGGVVAMFSILSSPLSNAITRYLTFELGVGNQKKLSTIFSTSINIQVLLSILIIVICEVIGIWFINEKMTIPTERISAATFVLHFSLLTFIFNLISVPYNASILSHEKMGVFAFIGIFDASLRLVIALLIRRSSYDKLVLYALLLFISALCMLLLYYIYCRTHFEETKYRLEINKRLFKEMASFAGWNAFGHFTGTLNNQGINLLVNLFFGLKVNASRAIADQVNNAFIQLVNNFTQAINPQITKSYAQGNIEYMTKLTNKGSKFSFFILLIFFVPFFLETDTVLSIWLVRVPENTSIFVRLILIGAMMLVMGSTHYYAIMATGKIKKYTLQISLLSASIFPISWLLFYLGAPAYSAYVVFAIVYFLQDFIRLLTLKRLISFSISNYYKKYFSRILLVTLLAFTVPLLFYLNMTPSIKRLIVIIIVSVIWVCLMIYIVGLDKSERVFIKNKTITFLKKIK